MIIKAKKSFVSAVALCFATIMLGMPAVEAKEMIPERDHTHSFTQHYYTGHGVLSYDSHTYVYYQYGNTQYSSLCTYSIENADFYAQCPSCGAVRSTSTCNHHYRDHHPGTQPGQPNGCATGYVYYALPNDLP